MKSSTKLALIILGISIAWIASGLIFKTEEAEEEKVISEEKEKSVRIIESSAEEVIAEFAVSGKTIAESSVVIKSELKGIVEKVVAKEGSVVKAGDIIVKIKEEDRKAKIAEAKAKLALKKLEYENYSSLVAKGFSTKVKKADTLSEYEQAKAELLAAELTYEKTFIRAPFSGYLEEIEVKAGDFLDVGSVITKIIKLDPIEIAVYVPERYINSVLLGEKAKIENKDYSFDAEVSFISKSALEQTRSFLVKLKSPNKDNKIPEGMTVRMDIPLKKAKAHLIKSSILSLNDDGDVGIKIIEEGNKVKFYKVQIIKQDTAGTIWVAGLPDKAKIITVGQEYVIDGEVINKITVEKQEVRK